MTHFVNSVPCIEEKDTLWVWGMFVGGRGGVYHGPGVRKRLVEMKAFYRRGASERRTISFIDKIPPEGGDDTY